MGGVLFNHRFQRLKFYIFSSRNPKKVSKIFPRLRREKFLKMGRGFLIKGVLFIQQEIVLICLYYSSEFDFFPISIIDNTVEHCIFCKIISQYKNIQSRSRESIFKTLESESGVDFQNFRVGVGYSTPTSTPTFRLLGVARPCFFC